MRDSQGAADSFCMDPGGSLRPPPYEAMRLPGGTFGIQEEPNGNREAPQHSGQSYGFIRNREAAHRSHEETIRNHEETQRIHEASKRSHEESHKEP